MTGPTEAERMAGLMSDEDAVKLLTAMDVLLDDSDPTQWEALLQEEGMPDPFFLDELMGILVDRLEAASRD